MGHENERKLIVLLETRDMKETGMGHENLLIMIGKMIKSYTMIKWDRKIYGDTRDMKGTIKKRLSIIM